MDIARGEQGGIGVQFSKIDQKSNYYISQVLPSGTAHAAGVLLLYLIDFYYNEESHCYTSQKSNVVRVCVCLCLCVCVCVWVCVMGTAQTAEAPYVCVCVCVCVHMLV